MAGPVLVTGANGSLGRALCARLEDPVATDLFSMDVTDAEQVRNMFTYHRPSLVYHLAAAKSAPDGELLPRSTMRTNVDGTWNVLNAAQSVNARVITASTCKACDPETVYGASKLIAERLTLFDGGSVARFYNIVESSGNVFETWRNIPDDDPIPVTRCTRFFITMEQAVELLLAIPSFPPGRYTVDPGEPRKMADVACERYPDRPHRLIPRRRGDRAAEPRHARHEQLIPTGREGIHQIVGYHDQLLAA